MLAFRKGLKMGLQVRNNWLPNFPVKVGWKRESKAEAVSFLMSPGTYPVEVRTGAEEQWFSLENARTQLLFGDKQGELVFPKAWGIKGNSLISPIFWFSTVSRLRKCILTCCMCPWLSPRALTAQSVRGLNSKDAFWEVYIYKHTPSCQVLGLCCQTIAFMSWGFSVHCKPSDAFHCLPQLVALC